MGFPLRLKHVFNIFFIFLFLTASRNEKINPARKNLQHLTQETVLVRSRVNRRKIDNQISYDDTSQITSITSI